MTISSGRPRTILISGAGIAGPALAYWLRRYGFTPTVIERAPSVRGGGHAVDFRGPVHLAVLDRMGLRDAVERLSTGTGDWWQVDTRGRRLVRMPAEQTGGDIEVLRGDLARLLVEATQDGTEYIFDDSITEIADGTDSVQVTFERGTPRTFDLVVGADGQRSRVRALTFGPDETHLKHLGLHTVFFTAPNVLELDHTGLVHIEPNRLVAVYSARGDTEARVMMYFGSPPLAYDRDDLAEQRSIVARAFTGAGWQVPRLLELMATAPDFHLDSASLVKMHAWTRGRIALVGDAGYGASSLSGMGSGLAVVGAYVLASELATAQGDHRIGFQRYEDTLRSYVDGCQKLARNAAAFMLPSNRFTAALSLRMQRHLPFLADMPAKMAHRAASAITLPTYPS
ncbi:FAD-dependent monooxygenase [Phytohabitans suffuscus]|uniref:FAD-dependent oxidoreductase n=1 Tax=Phytohabitans suffuscus TaxID=624315 RepID=A0A6F8YTJ7_9ACTN|nr:FAD-dependent monooxygenase [Phytohabitans suffuscus]BCB89389.1 FAD-dependent oxidoreductase [Phytohabitans suffuscus]